MVNQLCGNAGCVGRTLPMTSSKEIAAAEIPHREALAVSPPMPLRLASIASSTTAGWHANQKAIAIRAMLRCPLSQQNLCQMKTLTYSSETKAFPCQRRRRRCCFAQLCATHLGSLPARTASAAALSPQDGQTPRPAPPVSTAAGLCPRATHAQFHRAAQTTRRASRQHGRERLRALRCVLAAR
jgi:hypothetical protein